MIKILDRYIAYEFLKTFFMTLISLMLIYIVIHFFEKIDEIVLSKGPFIESFKYFFYKLPLICFNVTPIAVLVTTITVIGMLSKHNEIIIMKVCGTSLIRLTLPILLIGLCISGIQFLNSDYIIPKATIMSDYVFKVKVKGEKEESLVSKNNIWINAEDRSIWNIKYVNFPEKTLLDVNIFFFNEKRNLIKRVTSPEVKWLGSNWLFKDCFIYHFSGDGILKTERFEEKEFTFTETLNDLKKVEKYPAIMSIAEMSEYIRKTKSEGFDATKYIVDMHYKIAFPLICFIMALVGIPFSLKYERNFGLTFGIGLSIVIGFSFWITMSTFVSLGYSGVLPPVLSAWVTNLLYISMGVYLLLSVRQ